MAPPALGSARPGTRAVKYMSQPSPSGLRITQGSRIARSGQRPGVSSSYRSSMSSASPSPTRRQSCRSMLVACPMRCLSPFSARLLPV